MAKQLAFSVQEYQARLRALQQSLAARNIAGMLVNTPENITYLSGFQTPGYYMYQAVVVPTVGKPVLVARHLEAANVRWYSWLDQVVGIYDSEDPITRTIDVLGSLRLLGEKVGVELDSWFLTNRQVAQLREQAQATEFIDLGGTVERLRLIKSPAEVDLIRHACRQAEAAMRGGIAAVRPGATENDLAAAVYRETIAAGGEYAGLPPFILSGPRTLIPHGTWGGRVLEQGDVVYFELPGCIFRYSGALMRTVIIGRPTARHQHVAQASIAGLEAAIAAIEPGAAADEVDRACRETIAAAGYGPESYRHRCGYSIGINYPPGWGEGHILSLAPGEKRTLQAGMTFHIPPLIFEGDEFGIGFSETVLVTDIGCEVLTQFARELIGV